MTPLNLVKTLFLKASPEHVWRFLTEKDKLALWFHAGGHDLNPGGEYALVSNSPGKEGEKLCWGRVIEFDPPRKLVHTFTHQQLNGVETTCTWTLAGVDGGTVLTLLHEGFEKAEADHFNLGVEHDKGWDEYFMRLRRVSG